MRPHTFVQKIRGREINSGTFNNYTCSVLMNKGNSGAMQRNQTPDCEFIRLTVISLHQHCKWCSDVVRPTDSLQIPIRAKELKTKLSL